MPDKNQDTEKENPDKELQTEGPLDERDEVKKAEERTRKLQENAQGPLPNSKDTDK